MNQSIYDAVLIDIINLMKTQTAEMPIYIGALPPENALSVAWGASLYNAFMCKSTAAVDASIVFNGKHSNQQLLSTTMGIIHGYLSTLAQYPITDAYQITNIQTDSPPSLIEREENQQLLYGSSLSVKFFIR